MNILNIARKDVIVILRDRTALLMLLATPLVMIFMLGLALGPIFAQDSDMEPAVLGVVDKADMSGLPIPSVKQLLGEAELGQYLKVTNYGTEAEALKDLGTGRLAAVLVVPGDFGQRVMAGEPVELSLEKDPANPLGATIASTIVRRLVDAWNVHQTAIMVAVQQGVQDVEVAVQEQAPQLDQVTVAARNVNPMTRQPSAMEYYAVSMSVMYLLFAANTGAKLFLSERDEGTLYRMLSFPVTRFQVVTGKLLGTVVLGLGQMTVLLAVCHYAYSVDFGSSPIGLVLMIAASVFAAMGLGALVAAVGRKPEIADQLGVIVILVMSLLGGAMLPVYLFPDWLDKVSLLTFNRWALDGFFTLMFQRGTVRDVLVNGGVLVAMGVAFLGLSIRLMPFERS